MPSLHQLLKFGSKSAVHGHRWSSLFCAGPAGRLRYTRSRCWYPKNSFFSPQDRRGKQSPVWGWLYINWLVSFVKAVLCAWCSGASQSLPSAGCVWSCSRWRLLFDRRFQIRSNHIQGTFWPFCPSSRSMWYCHCRLWIAALSIICNSWRTCCKEMNF